MNNWRISPDGIAFIKGYEKLRLTAYPDQGGKWTIGWGHTGSDVHEGLVWTEMQADKVFVVDLNRVVVPINQLVTVELSQQQFDALCSLVYNIGVQAFRESTLLRMLNAGQYQLAGNEFPRFKKYYNKQTGKYEVSNGLIARRKRESEIFLLAMPFPKPPPEPEPEKLSWWERLRSFLVYHFFTKL